MHRQQRIGAGGKHLRMTLPSENIIPLPKPAKESLYQKAPVANLRKYLPTGTYHACAMVCGREVRKSLKTKSLEIAQVRLAALLKDERERLAKNPEAKEGWTFKVLADEWAKEIDSNPELKPKAKEYRSSTLKSIRENWKALDGLKVKSITKQQCQKWAKEFRKKYSSTWFNGCLQTLRSVLKGGVEAGLLASNPMKGIKHARVEREKIALPSREKIQEILDCLDAKPHLRGAALTVRFIMFTGVRISAARKITPRHIDLKNEEITLPPIKYQHDEITIPMIGDVKAVVEALLAEHPGPATAPLLPVRNPRKALMTASKKAGVATVTTRTLRHIFTTTCIESGVDIRTIARWRGDHDNGVTALKTYSHSRDEHSHKMAKKVKF